MNITTTYRQRLSRDRGFTIIEVLLCMAVTALLAMITVPTYKNVVHKFYDTAITYDLSQVTTGIEGTKTLTGTYPASTPDYAATAGLMSSVILTSPAETSISYKAAADRQSFALAIFDIRTGTVYCATADHETDVVALPARAGAAQCLTGV